MERTKLCVIGDPIEHSLSPVIHNTILEMSGLPFEYGRVQVKEGDTAEFLTQAVKQGFGGFNATMPHKTALLPLMEELDADAELFGAVNTVVLKDGKIRGCNTDGRGFIQMLSDHGFSPEGKTITILGAGGAAGAVALKLAESGANRVFVCNRTLEKAERLRNLFPAQITPCGFDLQQISDCTLFSDLIINGTPLGMKGVKDRFDDLSFLDGAAASATVCDLIYDPEETKFLSYAQEKGHPVINGLGMLIYQAIFALELFTDTKIDLQTVLPKVESAIQKELKQRI